MARADTQGGSGAGSRGGLIAHEAAIVRAVLASAGGSRSDLLTLLVAVPLLALVARDWVLHLPGEKLCWFAGGVGAAIGYLASSHAIERVAYHRTDGILAAAAQHRREQLRLIVAIIGAGAAIGEVGLLILGGLRVGWFAAGFALGALSSVAAGPLRRAGVRIARRLPRRDGHARPGLWRAVAAGGAVGIALALAPAQPPVAAGLAALLAIGVGAAFGAVDAEVVGYLTMMGHTSRAMITDRVARPVAFLVPMTAAIAIRPDWIAVATAGLFTSAIVALITLRVLAYRAFGRRAGDWFVGILLGVAVLALLLFPPLAPVVLLVGLARLARIAARRRWLIA